MAPAPWYRDELVERQEARERKEHQHAESERVRGVVRTVFFLIFAGLLAWGIVERGTVVAFVRHTFLGAPRLSPRYEPACAAFVANLQKDGEMGLRSAGVSGDTLVLVVSAEAWDAATVDARRSAVMRWHGAHHQLRVEHGLPKGSGAISPVVVKDHYGYAVAKVGKDGLALYRGGER